MPLTLVDLAKAYAFAKHGEGITGRTLKMRQVIYEKERLAYGKVCCFNCGEPITAEASTREHIIPKSIGGSNRLWNLALSHSWCNKERGPNFTERKVACGNTPI